VRNLTQEALYNSNYDSDPTNFPDDKENFSEDSESLSTIMLQMMNEKGETLHASPDGWSAEAVHFVEATATATPEELSDVSFT